ncbi:hypothetical protein AVEN_184305-1 [Araneus ventricosus]|uniref:Uncharacterized protein n=1 Tax=Araneus ventricosus TaxID=182803 RepID=A0A4Y2KE17_ARAVE|nr:hypothetical protein AVEN_184305-1 [Araneus ventricosus]
MNMEIYILVFKYRKRGHLQKEDRIRKRRTIGHLTKMHTRFASLYYKVKVKRPLMIPERPVGNTDNLYFVLQGGSLIHHAVSPKQETFGDVYITYMSYLKRHYGDEVTVLFDGYTERLLDAKGG